MMNVPAGVCKIMITFADRFRGRGLIRRKGTGQEERTAQSLSVRLTPTTTMSISTAISIASSILNMCLTYGRLTGIVSIRSDVWRLLMSQSHIREIPSLFIVSRMQKAISSSASSALMVLSAAAAKSASILSFE